jgi:hypothetical protein
VTLAKGLVKVELPDVNRLTRYIADRSSRGSTCLLDEHSQLSNEKRILMAIISEERFFIIVVDFDMLKGIKLRLS